MTQTYGSGKPPSRQKRLGSRLALMGYTFVVAFLLPAMLTPVDKPAALDARPVALVSMVEEVGPASGPDYLSAAVSSTGFARLQDLLPDPQAACLPVDAPGRKLGQQAEIDRLIGLTKQSPLGAWLLRQAAWRDVLICLDDTTTLNGYYRAGRQMIGIRSGLEEARRIAILAHELAHVPQHPRFSNNRYFPPEDVILLHRMREAAAETVATRVIWQLKERGYPAPWQAKAATRFIDMIQSFEEAMAGERGYAAERRAARAAFATWFAARWRVNFYDQLIIGHIRHISEDDMGLVPPRRHLTDDFLRRLGWLDGENYLHPAGPDNLTEAPYRVTLSPRNADMLEAILTDAFGPMPGPFKPIPTQIASP
ncbi:MAG: DUF6782 family putative metallopeptidase [Pseudomonadota bacterium]